LGKSEVVLLADKGKSMFDMPMPECIAGFMKNAVERHDVDQMSLMGLLL
jgi:hypothetical protein